MTTVVKVYDYAGFVSVELPYNLPPVISVISVPFNKKQAPLTPEQVNGALINRLTPGLSVACAHARRLPPAGPDVHLTMVGGNQALLGIVVYILQRQGMRVFAALDTSTKLNYSGPLLILRRQRVGTIGGHLQMVQRAKPASLHSVWS